MQPKKSQKKSLLGRKTWMILLLLSSLILGLLHYLHVFHVFPTQLDSLKKTSVSNNYIPLSLLLLEESNIEKISLNPPIQLRKEPETVKIYKNPIIITTSKETKSAVISPSHFPLFDKQFLVDKLNPCSIDIIKNLRVPILSPANRSFCEWALDPKKGGLIVGKSWGNLNKLQQKTYQSLNCNFVMSGANPSCDDTWGDGFVKKWRSKFIPDPCRLTSFSDNNSSSSNKKDTETNFLKQVFPNKEVRDFVVQTQVQGLSG